MSGPPFPPDPAIAARRAALVPAHREAFARHLAAARATGGLDPAHPRAVIPAAVASRLVADLALRHVEELMLLAIEAARALAQPPVSGYHVGAVGLAERSGDLILGGNLELPGASIWQTVHGEGFVTLLARARGERIVSLAISQARPCAHCRQVLAEMDGAHGDADRPDGLRLVDPEGRVLRLADVYPWPFGPGDLGMRGCVPGTEPWPGLSLADPALPADVAEALVETGRRAHAPYSRAPAAAVIRFRDGRLFGGAVLESVAFNPTIGPLQDALVGALAAGADDLHAADAAWLAVARGAPVAHEAATRDGLAALAPRAPLHVTYWS